MDPVIARTLRSLQRNILAGIITCGPLIVTYLIFSFVLGLLATVGLPIVKLLAAMSPDGALNQPWLQYTVSILLTLVVLYVVGRVTSQVVGRQAFRLFESSLERLPVVAKIYSSVRQLLNSMMAKGESNQRVVLLDFPMPGQKAVGFLTRTFNDAITGMPVAAVLLPNAINPTSALLQLVPLDRITETDLTMEQAMSLLMTGGAVGPDALRFTSPALTAGCAPSEEAKPLAPSA